MKLNTEKLIQYYFYATPLFITVDIIAGMPIRITAIESDLWRAIYYVGIIICSIIYWKVPRLTIPVSLVETVVNYALLIIVPFNTYIQTVRDFDGADINLPFDSINIINFIINGVILSSIIHHHINKLNPDRNR